MDWTRTVLVQFNFSSPKDHKLFPVQRHNVVPGPLNGWFTRNKRPFPAKEASV